MSTTLSNHSAVMTVSVLLAMALSMPAAEVPLAVPVDGEPFRAGLTTVDAGWQMTFTTAGQGRVLPAADVLSWGKCPELPRRPLLLLADGGVLAADVRQIDKDHLLADCDPFGAVKLPLEVLAGVVFQTPADRTLRDRLLDRIASASGDADRVILANDDELAGRVESLQKNAIQIKAQSGPLAVEFGRAKALILNPSLMSRPPVKGLRAYAGFSDGSRLVAAQLVMDSESLKITIPGGITWRTSPQQLTWLTPLGSSRVAYLSDRKPDQYRHVPFLELAWPFQPDRSVSGSWLRSGGRLHLKGLGVHSGSRLTYLLAEPYRRFQAELGIDDETRGRGSVRFRVLVDDTLKYESPTIVGGQSPVPVSVDLSGAKRLDLLVDYADRADEMDRADWLDARLVR